jgi:hypothetical protein
MKQNHQTAPDRFYSSDNEYFLEYENTDSVLPWRSHARLWIGRRSYLIPSLLAGPAVWNPELEAWFVPAWVIGHRQKIARIEPEMRKVYLSKADFEPFTVVLNDSITLHYMEDAGEPTQLNLDEVAWGNGRRF